MATVTFLLVLVDHIWHTWHYNGDIGMGTVRASQQPRSTKKTSTRNWFNDWIAKKGGRNRHQGPPLSPSGRERNSAPPSARPTSGPTWINRGLHRDGVPHPGWDPAAHSCMENPPRPTLVDQTARIWAWEVRGPAWGACGSGPVGPALPFDTLRGREKGMPWDGPCPSYPSPHHCSIAPRLWMEAPCRGCGRRHARRAGPLLAQGGASGRRACSEGISCIVFLDDKLMFLFNLCPTRCAMDDDNLHFCFWKNCHGTVGAVVTSVYTIKNEDTCNTTTFAHQKFPSKPHFSKASFFQTCYRK